MVSVHTITANVAPNKRECGVPGPNQPGRDDFAGRVTYNDAMPHGPMISVYPEWAGQAH